jgi:O-antigen ligase
MGYLFLLLAFSGALVASFANETNLSSFVTRRFAIQDYDSDRFAVQRAALESGLNHPLGIGPGHAERIFEKEALRHTGATHSLYLRVFSETGILGALSFLAILFVTIRKSLLLCFKGIKQHRRLHCALAAALGATLVNSFVIDSLHWRHLFVLIGIIWGVDIYNLWHRTRES